MRKELVEGLRYLLGHRYWRPIAATVALSNGFGALGGSIFLVYAVRELDMSAAVVGIVFGVGNVGWLIGAMVAGRLAGTLGVGKTILMSTFLFGPATLLIPLAPQSAPIPFFVASFILVSFAAVVFNVTAISFMQAVTPDRMLGRLNASRRFIVWGVIPLGAFVGGVLATQVGLRETLWIGAIGSLFACLPVLFSPVRSIGRYGRRHQRARSRRRRLAARCLSYRRWRRGCASSTRSCRLSAIEQAGPAHIATLKTFDPPLSTLDGRRLEGAERRGKNLLFPVDGDDLVLRIHLMSAGRLRFLTASAKKPKAPMFRLRFEGGAELVLTEGGKKKRAGVWLVTPKALDEDLSHLGPDALEVDASSLAEILGQRAPPAPPAAPRPARHRRHRPGPRKRDPAAGPALAVQGLDRAERGGAGAARRRDPRRPVACARAPRAGQGRQGRLPRPQPPRRAVPRVRNADRACRLRGAHGLLLPELPDRRPGAQGPPALQAPPLGRCGSIVPRRVPTARWHNRRSGAKFSESRVCAKFVRLSLKLVRRRAALRVR